MTKNYTELMALDTAGRESSFKAASLRADRVMTLRSATEKHLGKLLNAMIASGECEAGDGKLREKCIVLIGKDIKTTCQDVYGLVNVFAEILAETIDLTEADYDAMDKTKAALLSTFLGEKHRGKLPEAIAAAKTGTVKQMRDLKPKEESKASVAAKEAKAKSDGEIESLKEKLEKRAAEGTPITFGFIATDIDAAAPLVTSVQALNRLKADFLKAAADESEAGTTALNEMLHVFATMLNSVAGALECDAKEVLDEVAAKQATPASGEVIETAILAIA